MPDQIQYRRGDILRIQCDPSLGAEPRKTRTCVVVSNDIANRYGQVVTVVPTQDFTPDRARRTYIVDLSQPRSNLRQARVANASMVMTYDRRRVLQAAGQISDQAQSDLDEALRVHLALIPI